MQNILIIGSRGREHAVCRKLYEDNNKCKLFFMGKRNPGMLLNAIYLGPIHNVLNIAKEYQIDMVFIGPEKYLADGLVDILEKEGIKCIGPNKTMAQIETSKIFARNSLQSIGFDNFNPDFICVDKNDDNYLWEIRRYISNNKNFVIKPDGLCGGKGVKVFGIDFFELKDAINYCNEILRTNGELLIEERLYGEEFSLMTFTDGIHYKHMPPIRDYKRAFDGNMGPNTGSMGCIIADLGLTPNDIFTCQEINRRIIECLKEYKGILYGSFMKTNDGKIKVIEFNARFGDPECILVLEVLEGSLLDIFNGIINGNLNEVNFNFRDERIIFKYMVPENYPIDSIKNQEIHVDKIDDFIFADVEEEDGKLIAGGSRTLGCIGNLDSIHSKFEKVKGKLFYRKDIGGLTYAESGINIEEGNKVVRDIKESVISTFNNNVVSKFGDFGGMMRLTGMRNPVLVSSTDGVGTKSIVVTEYYGKEKGLYMLGCDIVNHCINDTLVKGAKPLFFLDYFASDKIKSNEVSCFVKGVADACREAECVLIGGETAEMPDVYHKDHFDIVGTMIGVVEEFNIIDGKRDIIPGDIVVGLPSSGPHTNGYTLIRKIINNEPDEIMEQICQTHKSYLTEFKLLGSYEVEIKGMCHITGGGLIDNPPRVLPDNLEIKWNQFEFSDIFKYIQKKGGISDYEMKRTFNCGIGMLLIIDPIHYHKIIELGINHTLLGVVDRIT